MRVEARIDHGVVSAADPLIAELAARTVREGLTNAARHAAGAGVVIDVREAGGMTVSIVSTGSTEAATQGSCHGIPSLRRRAELLGGSLDADSRQDGGFELRLLAPMRPETVAQRPLNAPDPALRSNARTARAGVSGRRRSSRR